MKNFDFFSVSFSTFFFFQVRGYLFRIRRKLWIHVFSKHSQQYLIIKVGCIRAKDEEFWNDSDDERKEREAGRTKVLRTILFSWKEEEEEAMMILRRSITQSLVCVLI